VPACDGHLKTAVAAHAWQEATIANGECDLTALANQPELLAERALLVASADGLEAFSKPAGQDFAGPRAIQHSVE
jgi:hypothetical protein